MRWRISSELLARIVADARAAHPAEACGLLFGGSGVIADAVTTANVAATPQTQFEIDPAALFAALRAERARGPQLIGYWHSHPSGSAEPSATDIAMAQGDGKLWLIVAGGAARLWRSLVGRMEEVELIIG